MNLIKPALFFRRALTIIDKYFEQLLQEQEFLSTSDRLDKMLKMIPDETLRSLVKKSLESMAEASLDRWNTFINVYENYCREVNYILL